MQSGFFDSLTDAALEAASVFSLVAVLPMHQHWLCSIRIKSARNIESSKAFELIVFRVPSRCNAIVVVLIDCVTLNRDIEIGRTPFLSRKNSIHIRAWSTSGMQKIRICITCANRLVTNVHARQLPGYSSTAVCGSNPPTWKRKSDSFRQWKLLHFYSVSFLWGLFVKPLWNRGLIGAVSTWLSWVNCTVLIDQFGNNGHQPPHRTSLPPKW